MIKLSEIKLNPNNPRKISPDKFAKLKKSISEFEKMLELRPLIVDENFTVIGGNQRLCALQKLGFKEVPDTWIKQATDLTDDEKARFVITDNSSFGEYDWELLQSDWAELPLDDWGVDLPDDWTAGEKPSEENDADVAETISKAAELQTKWQVKTGDLWELGEHRLLCGDSTKDKNIERLMGKDVASLVFTDPPYNVSYQANESVESLKNRNRRTDGAIVLNDAMSDEEFLLFLINVLEIMPLKDGGVFYLCSPPGNPETDFRIAIRSVSGLMLKQCIVWAKDQFVFGRQDYQWRHESILYGWKEGAAHYFVDDHTQDTVWEIERPKVSAEHPTMKPIEIPVKAVSNSSQQSEIVYEPFAGSGTTLIACEQLNRKCRAMEIAPEYVAVTLERWHNLTGKTPELINE